MCKKEVCYAFIDSQNLYLAIKTQGWVLSYKRFRQYLRDKYGIEKAFMFMGYLPGNEWLYRLLRNLGYQVVLKPTLFLPNGKIKGNVDAELVLHSMIEYANFDRAIIVTNDGDFYCLIDYLSRRQKFLKLMIPDSKKYSSLFKKFGASLVFMNDLRDKLEHKK